MGIATKANDNSIDAWKWRTLFPHPADALGRSLNVAGFRTRKVEELYSGFPQLASVFLTILRLYGGICGGIVRQLLFKRQ